jgi:hypothetical protein
VNNPGHQNAQNPRNWAYWKREALAFQSGLLPRVQSPLITSRCYSIREDNNGAWIWMEHIVETVPRHWTMEEYACAARHLGVFHASYIVGAPYKDESWLTDGFLRIGASALTMYQFTSRLQEPPWQFGIVVHASYCGCAPDRTELLTTAGRSACGTMPGVFCLRKLLLNIRERE